LNQTVFKVEWEELSSLTAGFLTEELFEVACQAFRRKAVPAFYQDVQEHLRCGKLFFTVDQRDGKISAFRIIKHFIEQQALILSGAAKRPSAPRYLVRMLTEKIIEQRNPFYIVTRTQNDYVVDYMRQLSGRGLIPLDYPVKSCHLRLLEEVGLSHPDLNENELIIPGFYGGQSMIGDGSRPRSSNLQTQEFMDKLDYLSGDARIIIGLRDI